MANNSSYIDHVPDDAINQLHRYRDALIHLSAQGVEHHKSRPVFGAFALYPGYFDQSQEPFPYAHAIQEIGIVIKRFELGELFLDVVRGVEEEATWASANIVVSLNESPAAMTL